MRFGRKVIFQSMGFVVLFAMWHISSEIRASPALPSPMSVTTTTWELLTAGTLTPHIAASLEITLAGITIAAIFGFALGVLIFRYKNFRLAVLPLIESVRGVASLTLFPLLKGFYYILDSVAGGGVIYVKQLRSGREYNSRSTCLRCRGMTGNVCHEDSSCKPDILTGIRIGVSGGWIGLVAAEMLGATRGLGYFPLCNAQSFQFERVYAAIITVAAIGA